MRIICDSMADVPKDIIEKFNVKVLPLTVIIDDKEYLDGIDLTHEEFYQILRNNENIPKTSQVTYGMFLETFEEITSKGEEILYIGGSSSASGTFQSATMARNDIANKDKIHLFDTYSLSVSAGLFVVKACQLKEQGLSITEIIKELEILKGSETAVFFVDDLKHLQKGGRISSTKATIGTLLKIKPILTLDEGIVVPHSQVRGTKQVYSSMIDFTLKKKTALKDRIILIGYCDNIKDLEGFKTALSNYVDLNLENIHTVKIGAGVSSHSGPSIIGIATL